MKKLVIIGGGFAGSYIARNLQYDMDVTLIDTKDYFEYTPGILKTIINPEHMYQIQKRHSDYLKKAKIVIGEVKEVSKNFVKVNDEKIALIGEIHPQVLMNWSLDMPTAVIELNITDIFRMMHLPTEVVIEHTHVEETHKKHSKKEHVHIAAKKTITRKHVVKKNSAHKPIKKKTVSHSKKSKKKK